MVLNYLIYRYLYFLFTTDTVIIYIVSTKAISVFVIKYNVARERTLTSFGCMHTIKIYSL